MVIEQYLASLREKHLDALTKRFWEKVVKTPTCWIWSGAQNQHGRGLFKVGRRTSAAPRVAWELANGPIPEGLFALHSCDNPSCVNPAHLRLGTHQENMDDRDKRGRTKKPLTFYSRPVL